MQSWRESPIVQTVAGAFFVVLGGVLACVVGALSAGIVIALVEVLLFRRRRRRIDY